jgi:hypothetical protein
MVKYGITVRGVLVYSTKVKYEIEDILSIIIFSIESYVQNDSTEFIDVDYDEIELIEFG